MIMNDKRLTASSCEGWDTLTSYGAWSTQWDSWVPYGA